MRISVTLSTVIRGAVERVRATNLFSIPESGVEVEVTKPRHPEHGDFATSVALSLGRILRQSPMEIAQAIASEIPTDEVIERVAVAPPGFININLSNDWVATRIGEIESQGSDYGISTHGQGRRVQVEFVSVNPTGPLHIGHARGAILGDIIANLLGAVGYTVEREYYLNDAGTQMDTFYATLYSTYMVQVGAREQTQITGDYAGEYMQRLAGAAVRKFGKRLSAKSRSSAIAELAEFGMDQTVGQIRATLERLGIVYDNWFSEKALMDSGGFQKTLDVLDASGHIARRDGAVWFKTTKFGGDEDDVVIRSGGAGHTYFGTDIAYHRDKLLQRKFEVAINIWGADHHSHITRLKAALEALGCDPARLRVVLNQIVRFKSAKGEAKFSKRAGNMVTIDQLVDEVGVDACRYLFVERTASSQMVFDIDLAKQRSKENPVYYIQYAHARIRSILQKAGERSIDYADGRLALASSIEELNLAKHMLEFADTIHSAAEKLEPHHLTHYAYELARRLQKFYETRRVLSGSATDDDDIEVTEVARSRLRLISAAGTVLASCLKLMGMSVPERM